MSPPFIHLFIVDPQNDFCDLPPCYCPINREMPSQPALPVPGAHQDMLRLANLIDRQRAHIKAITVSLDSHTHLDISHPSFWQHPDATPVKPFTQVNAKDVETGRIEPRDASKKNEVIHYLRQLEARQRYKHMIWPTHCEIGSWGQNIHEDVRQAIRRWESATNMNAHFQHKGEYPLTEHYSVFCAEVPNDTVSSTQFNQTLANTLKQSDEIWIAGEAGSHCIKATVEHLVESLAPQERSKIILLTDCMSPVPGFESDFANFLDTMRIQNVRIQKSTQIQ